MCQCLKYPVRPSKWRIELSVWEVVYFPCSRGNCNILFNLIFDIFWNSINLAYVSQLREKDLVYDYLLTLKESLTMFQIWIFCYAFTYFVPIGFIENRITKTSFKYFNENCDYSSCLS